MGGGITRGGAIEFRMPCTPASGALLLLAISMSAPAAAERCDDLAGQVVSVEGDVRVAGKPARMGMEICSDERVEIGGLSRAALRLEDTQTVVRIDQNSVFTIERSGGDRSLLGLLRGAIHLFSRRPESLRVNMPYVNAAIDGTEFVVEVSEGRSEVTVIEGHVLVGNAAGELRLAPGEAALAASGEAPARRVVVDPQNAVRWALHYPPIGAAERASGNARQAAVSLTTGDVDAATRLLAAAPEDAVALALESMIAVTRNRPIDAMRLAERAVELDPASSIARTALSYAHQARFDIDAALASARVAVRNDPRDSHALARQAELQLGVDEVGAAIDSALEATRVDPINSRAHTALGFARLIRLEVGEARSAFAAAIERDPGDPLPRLGLGLATIRGGRLAEGREHIEVAASLDPNDSLIRSYLGKAYFEERQADDAAAQFELAKSLDREDPTPWFYDALLAQALNRPASAYRDMERARALNANSLVYRSRLLVDKSDAAGSLSLARIYTDLGFEQPAINESTRSIAIDPTNFSAYRFLADSYAQRERHAAARRSVLFQASLLQPMTIDPVQPYAQESDLLILPGTDPIDPSIGEYSPLFDREGLQLAGSLVGGENRTFGDNLVLSALHERVVYSLGQFHYETEGFGRGADIEHDVYHGFVQAQLRPTLFLQAALHRRESERGDLVLSADPEAVIPGFRRRERTTSPHVGLRAELGSRSTLLLAARAIDRTERDTTPPPPFPVSSLQEIDGHEAFVRFIHRNATMGHTFGVDTHQLGLRPVIVLEVDPCPAETCRIDTGEVESSYANYYYYADVETDPRFHWTLGLGYTTFDDELSLFDRRDVNPRFGLRWRPRPSQELRLMASRGTKRSQVADLMLEPTVLAGFNQVHDDFAGTRHVNAGLAYDWQIGPSTLSGLELLHRELDVPVTVTNLDLGETRSIDESQRETMLRGYWSRILRPDLSLGVALTLERSERDDPREQEVSADLGFPLRAETVSLPIGIRYAHPSGFFAQGELGFVHQSVERIDRVDTESATALDEDSGYFTNLDLSLGVRLPTRRATFRLDIGNLLDEAFLFRGSSIRSPESSGPRFSPARTVVGRVSFSFR